ncbi:MAG: TolC family protein [Bacteroidales bacterium]
MKILFSLVACSLLILDSAVFGQRGWTLDDCINYAVENNLQIKRQGLRTESRRVDLEKSKFDLLPGIGFESEGNMGFGRSIDPVTNLITFEKNMSNSYSLTTSLTLFSGFSAINTMEANRYMLKAGIEEEKTAVNALVIDIMTAYYQVLYTNGMMNSALLQLEQSEKQLFRIAKNVDAGREAVSTRYQMESKTSEDRLSYTISRNDYNQAVTSLKQILQLTPATGFILEIPDQVNTLNVKENFRADSIFTIASGVLPRLKAIEYELLASRKQVSIARGGFSPKISIGAGVFTGYYETIGTGVVGQKSFKEQIKDNNSQAIYARLQIPIFNNFYNARNIKLAKIRKADNEYRLEIEKNSLFTDVDNACMSYNRSCDEYVAALDNLGFNKKSFEVIRMKFEAGLVDITDYSSASVNLAKAEAEVIRTRLQLLIRRMIIKLYTTGDYKSLINS